MAIWCEMKHDTHYHKKARYVRQDEVTLKDWKAYTMEPVF